MTLLVKGGRVINPALNQDEVCDILIENGKIKAMGNDIDSKGADVFDASGCVVAPGFIDMHVHLRQPGQTAKETVLTGSRAAAAGGITRVATMPNTKPVIDKAIIVEGMKYKAEHESVVKIEVIGAVSKGLEGKELSAMGGMAKAGAVAFSDDGHYIDNSDFMRKAMEYANMFNKIIIDHCEESSLVSGGQMHEGVVSAELGLKGRPAAAEDIAVARDIILSELTNTPIHIAHISSKNAIDMVRRAKAKGIRVTAGLEGLKDGTIDAIVTDHAPHTWDEKDQEFSLAPSGFVGLETSVGAVLTFLYHTGQVDLMTIVRAMSTAPAKLLGLDAGVLAEGKDADITILDKEWTVDASAFYSKGKSSPFDEMIFHGKAKATIVDGEVVMNDGVVLK